MNCGAFSESLVESELFGHEQGAFTGAASGKAGWFETADGGTLFLDEIGDLPPAMQVKLLRVLQEREVVRLGSRKRIPIDVRVLAATNVDLEKAINAGHFREDLYYRLDVVSLDLPPLRERPGDILPLTRHFLDQYRLRLGAGPVDLHAAAARRLLEHAWPGNIRELENVIHSALVVSAGPEILATDLNLSPPSTPQHLPAPTPARSATAPVAISGDPLATLERALLALYDHNLPDLHAQLEAAVMRTAFNYCHRNQLQTARLLGISRNIVRARLLQLGEIAGGARSGELPPPA